jgi:lipopolysaccharide/colanic/teichoic acid biosynthesis glycosyltransferase
MGGAVAPEPGMHLRNTRFTRTNLFIKSILDLIVVIPSLLIGMPIMALAALVVMIASPGNPFFAHEREGLNGRGFRVWKIRTMHLNAEAMLRNHLQAHPQAREEWERHFKLTHDPRIIPVVGPLLRKTSIDELPQLFNVLRGEMSVVGPRPFPRYHLKAFSKEFREFRTQVRPGITGLWQVSSRSDGDLGEQEEADTFYIRNWSIWMDLYVLARTPIAVLAGKGAR